MQENDNPEAYKNATIMLIDDESTTLEVIQMFLEGEGYREIVTTTDSTQALDLFFEVRPDLVMCDLMMPRVGGLDILQSIRRDPSSQHIPLIILTSSTDSDTKLRALELGATDFLSKPVVEAEMALRLRNTLIAKSDRDRLAEYQAQPEHKDFERTLELARMRIKAERASEAKSHFLANMSHEIRTPMTAICGYTEELMEDAMVGADQRESLDIIKRNGDHLLAIINSVLDLSKIEAEQLQLERAPVDLVGLLREAVRTLELRADENELDVGLDLILPLPTSAMSDGVRIRQALINVLGNALKFTREGSVTVRVGYSPKESAVRIDVIDTGIGVATELIPGLFRQFEQADASTSREFGGTGLGLAITRRLARLLGGDCTMESEVGVGTCVRLKIQAPLAPGAEILQPQLVTLSVQKVTPSAKQASLDARILYAEDAEMNQKLISRVLTKAGADVEIAENGRIAVDRMSGGAEFDLILMDMAMPEMDGYTATRTLREMGFTLPIVALTAHTLEGDRDRCRGAGGAHDVTKPIDKVALIGLLRSRLEK